MPEPDGLAGERRVEPRYPASAIPQITSARLSSGGVVALVNISSSGILVEGTTRLVPGKQVSLDFEGTFEPKHLKATIVRCQVSAIEGGTLRYRTALTFASPLELPIEEAGPRRAVAEKTGEPSGRKESPAAAPEATPEPARVFNRW
jgi:hypothetical protein